MFLLLPLFLWSVILVQPVLVGLVGFRAGTIEVEKESPSLPFFFLSGNRRNEDSWLARWQATQSCLLRPCPLAEISFDLLWQRNSPPRKKNYLNYPPLKIDCSLAAVVDVWGESRKEKKKSRQDENEVERQRERLPQRCPTALRDTRAADPIDRLPTECSKPGPDRSDRHRLDPITTN